MGSLTRPKNVIFDFVTFTKELTGVQSLVYSDECTVSTKIIGVHFECRYLTERLRAKPGPAAVHFRHDEHSFLDHSSIVLGGCLNNTAAEDATQWDGLRGLLEEVGLGDWPYVEPWTQSHRQSFQLDETLKLVDRRLAIFPILYASLRNLPDESSYVMHVDAPRSFLFVQYAMQRTSKSLPYQELIRQTLSLWKTLPRSNAVAEDVMRFEAQLLEASRSSPAKEARDKKVVYTMNKLPKMPRFRMDVYLSYLRGRNDGSVVVLKPAYIRRLSDILRKPSPRTILNFLGVLVVSHMAPLLPPSSIPRGLIRMGYPSFQHHVDPRTQSCFHLVNRLYPHGFRWILRDVLAKDTDLDLQWAATIRHMVTSLARTFREGTTWMQSEDVPSALKRLNALQVNYLAGKEDQAVIDEYYASMNASHGPENLIGYYGSLLAASLQKYWETSPDDANYDARFAERSTDLDVAWTQSPESALKVYLTSSGVASASQVTRADLPSILLPLLAADVTRALLLTSLYEPQWSNWTRDRFRALRACLLDHYGSRVHKHNLSSTNMDDIFDDILTDNAVIRPLIVAYLHFSHGSTFVPSRRDVEMSAQKLFFINYAAGFCVPKSEVLQARERLRYQWGLPPRIRVNLALLELKAFRDAFKCPHQSVTSRCPVWKHEDEETLSNAEADN
ncbi:hypothetical protein V5799_003741 [Amblyomma americanum]|uniref:Uncharacterized protein n=1 Tax=Amblyomma americanum TaxID=6943 RepID=A0AAQ4D835_AMBAM